MKSSSLPAAIVAIAAACGSGTEPQLGACTSSANVTVSLSPGGFNAFDPGVNACFAFPANSAVDTAEYVIVAQSATTGTDRYADFQLTGAVPTASLFPPLAISAPPSPVEAFHAMLRENARNRFYGAPPPAGPDLMAASRASRPPQLGEHRQFGLCAVLSCQQMIHVDANVVALGQNLAIYADQEVLNSLGLTDQQLDSLVQVFDTRLFPLDTTSFGGTSDRDGNGLVTLLLTPVVNRLVTEQQCTSNGAFVTGFFYGADLDTFYDTDTRFSHGEVFYALVPDPAGSFSCAHPASDLMQLLPTTFVHELQHMINFNQHVLVKEVRAEEPWLDEGLSHFAEELAGRSYLSGDTASFSKYVISDVINAYKYLNNPGSTYLLTEGGGSLAERGAAWLFVRYVVDQERTDPSLEATQHVTRALVQRNTVGAASVAFVSGRPFDQTVARWALANWVSDLPGFTAPPELRYRSWFFRSTFQSVHNQNATIFPKPYPLTPDSTAGTAVSLSGVLHSGSGFYHRVIQIPGASAFTLQLSNGSGGAVRYQVAPQLAVVRIR